MHAKLSADEQAALLAVHRDGRLTFSTSQAEAAPQVPAGALEALVTAGLVRKLARSSGAEDHYVLSGRGVSAARRLRIG